MITELAIAGLGMYAFDRFKERDLLKIKKSISILFNDNKLDADIINIEKTEFGYKLTTDLKGIGFLKLENTRELIESKLGYNTYISQNNNLRIATIDIITKKLKDTTKFQPILTKAFEFYAGLNFQFEHLKSNLQSFPHVLVSGQTGSGKTEIIRLALTNLIYNFNSRDVNIYFSDLSDMCDFEIFKHCEQVRGYAKTIEESYKLFEYMMHIYTKRLSLFRSKNCKNIQEYNKRYSSKRMNYIYLVLDEFADYFPQNRFENDYNLKIQCYNMLKHMVRKFRKAGIFLIIGIQRPDTTVLDPSLRSGLCTKIGFSQNTNSSSLVVCDTTELTNIENREGLFMYGNTREWFKSLYINDSLIKKYIKNSIVKENKNFNKFLQDVKTKTSKQIKSNAPIKLKDIKTSKNKTTTKSKSNSKTKSKVKVSCI